MPADLQPSDSYFASLVSVAPILLLIACLLGDSQTAWGQHESASAAIQSTSDKPVRFASYNVALNRRSAGALKQELRGGNSAQARKIAEVIQRTRPDVLLLCEFDYDEQGEGLTSFQKEYLAVAQNGAPPIEYKFRFYAPVNTGVDSGLDLDGNGKMKTGNDAFGFGLFPGQYAMAVLSRYPIDTDNIRTFQNFLWKDMPNAALPVKNDGTPYYSDQVLKVFRLSSKSHWDVPIKIGTRRVHFLASHPTPPVFDGPEDKNGKRNHDEIRMFADYVSGAADYLYDDNGKKGGLADDALFVIAGDLNADPQDGDSFNQAILQLLNAPRINSALAPTSLGGSHFSKLQAGANQRHKGNPAHDTGDFNDRSVGNMRIDYCLPSKSLTLKKNGVFWPLPEQPAGEAVKASDHRMVWIDVTFKN